MLDIALLRRDLDQVIQGLNTRKQPQPFLNVQAFQSLEAERKTLQTRTEELQAKRNSLSKNIGQMKAKGESTDALMAEVGQLKDELDSSAQRLETLQIELQTLLLAVPNLPQDSVPIGADEHANMELRRWSPTGTEPVPLDFTAKDHVDIGEPLGLDFETGVLLSGSRFAVMKGPLARLHRALAQFMLDEHNAKVAAAAEREAAKAREAAEKEKAAAAAAAAAAEEAAAAQAEAKAEAAAAATSQEPLSISTAATTSTATTTGEGEASPALPSSSSTVRTWAAMAAASRN